MTGGGPRCSARYMSHFVSTGEPAGAADSGGDGVASGPGGGGDQSR